MKKQDIIKHTMQKIISDSMPSTSRIPHTSAYLRAVEKNLTLRNTEVVFVAHMMKQNYTTMPKTKKQSKLKNPSKKLMMTRLKLRIRKRKQKSKSKRISSKKYNFKPLRIGLLVFHLDLTLSPLICLSMRKTNRMMILFFEAKQDCKSLKK